MGQRAMLAGKLGELLAVHLLGLSKPPSKSLGLELSSTSDHVSAGAMLARSIWDVTPAMVSSPPTPWLLPMMLGLRLGSFSDPKALVAERQWYLPPTTGTGTSMSARRVSGQPSRTLVRMVTAHCRGLPCQRPSPLSVQPWLELSGCALHVGLYFC